MARETYNMSSVAFKYHVTCKDALNIIERPCSDQGPSISGKNEKNIWRNIDNNTTRYIQSRLVHCLVFAGQCIYLAQSGVCDLLNIVKVNS